MPEKLVVDADNQPIGRVASEVAKMLLDGKDVTIINAKFAIITGNPKRIIERYMQRRSRGDPHHGPFYPKRADAIMRRTIRGMLPYKKPRGREAMRRLVVHSENPTGKEGVKVAQREIKCKYITLGDLERKLRGQ
jgi:large subunit ribosomal protein L13